MVMGNINLSFYTYKNVIFYGKGKLKDCRKKLFRIYLYFHGGDAPADCTAFAFSYLSGYTFRKMARLSHCSIGSVEQMCYDRMDQTNEERGRRRMASEWLNVTDVCDVVEFHESADGVALYGQEGRWTLSAQRGGKMKWIMSRT